MGKRNHVIKAVHDFVGGRGFSEDASSTFGTTRNIVTCIRDFELVKAAFTMGVSPVHNELELVQRCRERLMQDMKQCNAFENIEDLDVSTDFPLYIALFDDYARVTKAKSGERQQRDKDRRERATAEQLVPYTKEELESFFATERHGNDAALEAAAMPDSTRLRLTPSSDAKNAAMRRLNELMKWALASGKYSEAVALLAVHDGESFFCLASTADDEENKPDFLPMGVPKGICEAESLAVYYAFSLVCEADKVSALRVEKEDGDTQMKTADESLNSARRNSKQLVVINVADTDAFMQCMFAAEAVFSQSTCSARVVLNLTPFSMMGKGARTNPDYGYYVDCFTVYAELLCSDAGKKIGCKAVEVLAALELIGSLGGTDKVPSVTGITSDSILSTYLRVESPKNRPTLDVSMFRKALADRCFVYVDELNADEEPSKRLRTRRSVFVNEEAVLRFLIAAYAYKFKTDVQMPVCAYLDVEGDEALQHALKTLHDEGMSTFERLKREYPKKAAKREREIAAYEALSDEQKKAKKGRKPRALAEPVPGFVPTVDLPSLRRLVRQTVWQLWETVNAAVPDGVPDACARSDDGEKSVWGWTADGSADDNIAPFVAMYCEE